MHRTHFIKGDAAIKLKYKKFSDKLTKIKTNAKKKHFAEELEKINLILTKRGNFFAG